MSLLSALPLRETLSPQCPIRHRSSQQKTKRDCRAWSCFFPIFILYTPPSSLHIPLTSTSSRVVAPLAALSRSEQALASTADLQTQVQVQKHKSNRDLEAQYIRAQRCSYLGFRDTSSHIFRLPVHQRYTLGSSDPVFLSSAHPTSLVSRCDTFRQQPLAEKDRLWLVF